VFFVHDGAQKEVQVGFIGVTNTFANLHVPLPVLAAVIVTLVEFTVEVL
jgi:hypothetical protein